ncbi:MAG: hypothetical protein ACRD1O_11830, partial [Terriglobia bacterium]
LPALVPLSALMAAVWQEVESVQGSRLPDWLTAGLASMILIGLLIAASTRLLSFHSIRAHLAAKLPPPLIAALAPSMLLSGAIIAALGFLGRNMATRRSGLRARALIFVVVAVTLPLLTLRWIRPVENYYSVFSSRALAHTIFASQERDLPVYGYYYFRTGLPFYLRRPVGLVTNDGDEMTSNYVVSRFKTLKKLTRGLLSPLTDVSPAEGAGSQTAAQWMDEPLFVNGRQLQLLARTAPGPFLLMVRDAQINQALAAMGSMKPLWQAWQFSVWEKKPQPR